MLTFKPSVVKIALVAILGAATSVVAYASGALDVVAATNAVVTTEEQA